MAHTQSTVAPARTLFTSVFPHAPAQLSHDIQSRIARRMALDDLIEPHYDDETCEDMGADLNHYPTAA